MRRIALLLLWAACACSAEEVTGPSDATPGARDARPSADAARVDDDGAVTNDDAATRDAGMEDAAPIADDAQAPFADARAPDATAPVDAGAAAGDCTGAPICDDFESYASGGPPGGPWAVRTAGGTARMDETRAFSGRRSVRITTAGGSDNYHRAYIEASGAPIFPLPNNVMWGRMMIYVTAVPPNATHWTNIEGEGQIPSRPNVRAVYRYGGQFDKRIMANYDSFGARSDCWDHSTTTLPEARWACMEWRFDGPNDQLDLWVDGTQLTDVTVRGMGEGCIAHELQDRWYAPTFNTVRLGWEHYQASMPIEMWIDDVAVAGARIGCR